MKDGKMVVRALALVATMLLVLFLLVGAYTAGASPAAPAGAVPALNLPHAPNAGYWASGWQSVTAGTCQQFTHNLGGDPDNFAVDMLFWDTDAGGVGINRRNYGGLEAGGNFYGAHWQNLTATTVDVCRGLQDVLADLIRVAVWVAPTPDFARTWTDIAQGETHINHGLGGNATDLTVGLYFKGVRGIHQYAYGGLTDGAKARGAYWSNLTNTTVDVTRRLQDSDVEQVRVVVARSEPPAYDSLQDPSIGGWKEINPGDSFTFNHNLNWPPEMMLVREECNQPSGFGINQIFAGGDESAGSFRGGNIQKLTSNSVDFFRQANDSTCPQARIVIYKRSNLLYLPLILR